MNYKIIIHRNFSLLENRVEENIKNSWEPVGGVSQNNTGRYLQAMIKKENIE